MYMTDTVDVGAQAEATVLCALRQFALKHYIHLPCVVEGWLHVPVALDQWRLSLADVSSCSHCLVLWTL